MSDQVLISVRHIPPVSRTNDSRRRPNSNNVWWNTPGNNTVSTDNGPVANFHAGAHEDSTPKPHVSTDLNRGAREALVLYGSVREDKRMVLISN